MHAFAKSLHRLINIDAAAFATFRYKGELEELQRGVY